jgi:glycosyltransferase involved in cell wall biosynthesis
VKIAISSPTRFHLFDLARELARRDHHVTLFNAGLPTWSPDDVNLSAQCAPWLGLLVKGSRLADGGRAQRVLDWQLITRFDRWVARHLSPSDVVVALSGRGLKTLQRAKDLGALAVCDRGSTHVQFQDETLAEEYALWGFDYPGIDPRGIDRELREYETADLVTVPSTFCAQTFVARGLPKDKVAVVPYGVDLEAFHPRPPRDTTAKPFRVLFAGRLSLRKGVQYLLAAYKGLRRTHPSVELWLAGGVDREVDHLLRADPLPVTLLGHLPHDRLAETYREVSLFVLPSLEEGLATVVAQAMASGLPVIVTPNTGARDLIEDGVGGFIVPPRSSVAIEEAIRRLIENPTMRQGMGHRARASIEHLGGWSGYAALAEAAYEGVS